MEYSEVEQRVDASIQSFQQEDRYLLEHNLNERCIAARLAFHLQRSFPEFSVDVEYNRVGGSPKRLALPEECANSVDDEGHALVVPDVIVHRRGPDGVNILVVELKKVGDRRGLDCDRRRIQSLKARLNYCFGVLIECETRARHEPRIFVHEWLQ